MPTDSPASPTSRLFRALPNHPYIVKVPSDNPFRVRSDLHNHEYTRMAGTNFTLRRDNRDESHLQHLSFLNRDIGGTLFTQHEMIDEQSHRPSEAPSKRIKREADGSKSTPNGTPAKKKITLADYKTKAHKATSTPSTPDDLWNSDLEIVTPPPGGIDPELEAQWQRLLEREKQPLAPERLAEVTALFPPDLQLMPSHAAAPAAREVTERTVARKESKKLLSEQLQETGIALKRRFDALSKQAESASGQSAAALEGQALAKAVESIVCFMRSFTDLERRGKSAKALWPTLYSMLNLVARRSKKSAEISALGRLLDATVCQRALMAFGSVEWSKLKDEKARAGHWEGVSKATTRLQRCQESDNETLTRGRLVKRFAKAVSEVDRAGLGGLANVTSICDIAIVVLSEWTKSEGIDWKFTTCDE